MVPPTPSFFPNSADESFFVSHDALNDRGKLYLISHLSHPARFRCQLAPCRFVPWRTAQLLVVATCPGAHLCAFCAQRWDSTTAPVLGLTVVTKPEDTPVFARGARPFEMS